MKTVLFPKNDNTLIICALTSELSVDKAIELLIPNNIPYKIVESLTIDNNFFDAYEFDKEVGAKINISKAKDIWLDHYRTARTPLLEKLDMEYMRADESGNLNIKKELAAKKQALRDVTKTELPNTLEGIKNTWPEILGKNPFNS